MGAIAKLGDISDGENGKFLVSYILSEILSF